MKYFLTPLASAMVLGLSGCAAVGPDYVAPSSPELKLPAQWAAPTSQAAATVTDLRKQAWWRDLADPTLNELVAHAQAASPTVEAAVARLAEARASRDQVFSSALPGVTGSANVQRADQGTSLVQSSSISTSASWEIDLFGAVKRGVEGAQARVQARQADVADAHVSLAADVADAYSTYRQCTAAVGLTEADQASRESTAQLTTLKADAGFVAPYLAARAQATVSEGKTALTALKAQCERAETLLVRLTGLERAELKRQLAQTAGVPSPVSLDVILPQEVLTARPDLVMAERAVAAAAADAGLYEANRYPRLTLSGSLGFNTSDAGKGSVSLGMWSFGPSLTVPLFDGGSRKAAAVAAQARFDQALAAYKLKARTAVQEVEDALTRYGAAAERRQTADDAVHNYASSFDAMNARYQEGAASLLELEDARRALLGARQTANSVRLEQAQAWIALHRATGGGWQSVTSPTDKPAH